MNERLPKTNRLKEKNIYMLVLKKSCKNKQRNPKQNFQTAKVHKTVEAFFDTMLNNEGIHLY